MMSSANVAETGISGSWNNTYTVANNKTLYDANVDNFNDMLPDTTNTNYYHTVSSGPYKAYFFPRAGSSPTSDTFYNVLSDVSCTGATGGYGSNGRTVIKLSTYTWTSLRLYLADKLTELAKKGCQIEVVYPGDNVDKEVATELLSEEDQGLQRSQQWSLPAQQVSADQRRLSGRQSEACLHRLAEPDQDQPSGEQRGHAADRQQTPIHRHGLRCLRQ